MREQDTDIIMVLIEQTGVTMGVPRSYYEAYKSQGVRFISEIEKEPELSYVELKEACAEKGLEHKGNASKEDLKKLLEA